MKRHYHHIYPTIQFLLNCPPKIFKAAYPKNTAEARKQLEEWSRQGYICGPGWCDHQDAQGNCLGHEEELTEEEAKTEERERAASLNEINEMTGGAV